MSDLLTRIRSEIDARLDELRPAAAEAARLENALQALRSGGRSRQTSAPSPAAGPGAGADGDADGDGAASGRARAPKGANREAILEVVRQRPGVSAAEVASVTKIAKPTVDSAISRLKRDGVLIAAGFGGVKLAPPSEDGDAPA